MHIDITFPDYVLPLTVLAILYAFISFGMASFLGTDSYKDGKNLDLFFLKNDRDVDVPAWKKRMLAWSLIIFATPLLLIASLCGLLYLSCVGFKKGWSWLDSKIGV